MDTKGAGIVLVLVILGLFLGAIGFLPTFEHNLAVQEGQPTAGVVESIDIDVKEDDDGDKSYNPDVVYSYAVDGQTYRIDNTYPGRFTRWKSSRSSAEHVVGQYEPGDEVVVHYDPDDPANAYLRNDGLPGTWFIGLGYAGFAAVSAVGLIVTGVRRWKQRQLMVDTPTANVQSVSIGPAELKGTALLDGRAPMAAPFSDDECLVASYEIEEYDEDEDDEGGKWKTIEEDTQFIPFELDDGTGRIRIEPTSDATFDLEPEDWDTTYVDSSSQGPEAVQRFVRGRDGLGFPSNASGKENDRKYRQNLIRPEESVYVYGAAQPREDAETASGNASRLVVTSADDTAVEDTMFMISDDSEEDLTDRRALALWRAPAGGFFLLVALAFTLGILGPEIGLTLPDII